MKLNVSPVILVFTCWLSACSTEEKLDLNAVVSKAPSSSLQPEATPPPTPSAGAADVKVDPPQVPLEVLNKSLVIQLYGKKALAVLEAQLPEVVIEQAKKTGTKLDTTGLEPANGNVCIQGLISAETKFDLQTEKWFAKLTIDGKLRPVAIGLRPDGSPAAKGPTDRIRMRACTKTKHFKVKTLVIEVFDRKKSKLFRQAWQPPWPN